MGNPPPPPFADLHATRDGKRSHNQARVDWIATRSLTHENRAKMKIENVIDNIGNRFATVVVAARRARQINAYYSQLGGRHR